MNNQVLRVVVMIGAIAPFVMLGYKLFEKESLLTAAFYAAIVIILLVTVVFAWRAEPAAADAPAYGDGRDPSSRETAN